MYSALIWSARQEVLLGPLVRAFCSGRVFSLSTTTTTTAARHHTATSTSGRKAAHSCNTFATHRSLLCQPTAPHLNPFSYHTKLFSTTSLSLDEGAPHFKESTIQHPLTDKISSLPSEGKAKGGSKDGVAGEDYTLPHPIWSREEAEAVQVTHTPPTDKVDKAAYFSVRTMRLFFDLFSGYTWGKVFKSLDERKWLTRIIFLETVAGVPGMIGAMTRHLKSLRMLQRDNGWIHTLLEEAENERMHLLTALELRNPGRLFRGMVVGAQGVFVTMFWIVYAISPRFCHRFVGYLEEEAVITYTLCLKSIDEGHLPMWEKMPAPEIAVKYWKLPEGAMMRDTILAIRADEAHHRVVNHTLSSMKQHERNPHKPGQ